MNRSKEHRASKGVRNSIVRIAGQCFLIILLHASLMISAQPQEIIERDSAIYLSGKVVDNSTKNGLFHVHVINLSMNRATLSDRFGYFTVQAKNSDTLYFSHVGYKKRLYRLKTDDIDTTGILSINLYEDTIMLKKFRLLSATKQAQFKSDFVNRPFIPDTLNPAFEAFMKENYFSAPMGGIVLPGPFTLIYENFNKSARLQRRIERNRAQYYDNLPEEEKRDVLFYDE